MPHPEPAPPVAPLWCDDCCKPMTEIAPGVWKCVSPAMLLIQSMLTGQPEVRPVIDFRRHKA